MPRASVLNRLIVLALCAAATLSCGDDSGARGSGGAGVIGNGGGATGGGAGAGAFGGSGGGAGAGGASSGGSASSGGGGASGGSAGGGGSAVGGAGGADAGSVPLPGQGTLLGDCGPLSQTEILSSSPYSYDNSIDFGSSVFDYNLLSLGGKKAYDDGNLGGSSLLSEVFSYEVLYRCELAKLLKTEAEIVYTDAGGKKTDLLVEIEGYKVGVSVTRAFIYPPGTPYTVSVAQGLLEKKLGDIVLSSKNVATSDAWKKQILHVLAYDAQHKDALKQAYPLIAPATRADTVVMVTVTDGNDAFIY
ncbi:MAG: hypothetical protein IPI67_32375 [Myxococcales bacterium]|nr:hypothetical protein [Myxococcales bacterium]